MQDFPTTPDFERIAAEITSDDSPVGIDAKKTHVMILAKLEGLERRLTRIEEHLASGGSEPSASSKRGG